MAIEIMVRSSGINWVWYHRYEIDGNTAKQVWSDRFHKFDKNQGAENHPVWTHYVEMHSEPSETAIAAFARNGRDILKSHNDWCDRENLPHGPFIMVRPKDDYKNVTYYSLIDSDR